LRIGIVGCGAIGSVLFRAFDQNILKADEILLYDIVLDKCRKLAEKAVNVKPILCSDIDCFIKNKVELVVEAASQEAVKQYAGLLLSNGINMVILSVGALLDPELYSSLVEKCSKSGARIYVPSGAIAGVDAVKALSLFSIDKVTLITRKNPRAFGEEVLRRYGLSMDMREPYVLFEGSAEEAVKMFPANINVAATLKLASNKPVRVRIVADPSVKNNVHEIIVESTASKMHVVIENTPHPENPKTSYIAALSAIQLLKQLTSGGVIIGT